MLAFLFPGQGSQTRGMGGDLFDRVRAYTAIEAEVDRLLGYSVRDLCANGPDSRLKDTRYTQPCLFVVNALHYYDALETHGSPAVVAGHSLGEYNALMAAGAFDFLTGLRLVARRAELMAATSGGSMSAVLKLPADRILQLLDDEGVVDVDVANYNSPRQTVIAGPAAELARAADLLGRAGGTCVPLAVSAPFHSRYMAGAAERFGEVLEQCAFQPLMLPVISNVTGRPHATSRGALSIRAALAQQITKPVRWAEGIRHLHRLGITTFVETGPGTVLTRLNQQIAAAA